MAKTQYGKNIFYQTRVNPYHVPGGDCTGFMTCMHTMDNTVLPGAWYLNTTWQIGADKDKSMVYTAHRHDFDEYLALYGSDADHPYELNGEVEFWMEDEKHIITKSCVIFVPKNVWHCPIWFRRVDRPIFFFTNAPVSNYILHPTHDPKWNGYKPLPPGAPGQESVDEV